MYKNILVAYDGSDSAKLAIKGAIELGRKLGSGITALWVRDSLPHFAETIDEIEEEKEVTNSYEQKLSDEIEELEQKEGFSIDFISLPGNPAKVVVEYATKFHSDLIVTGHTSHHNLWGNLLGNTADKISDHAPCNVLIVRKKKSELNAR
ncbi:MAG TPA: universal stress protein [Parafilimonas sp.]|nr:universal stress protein [Parafilimonas sp.]